MSYLKKCKIIVGWVIALAPILSAPPFSWGANLPEVSNPLDVGRIRVFKSSKDVHWFLPSAFSGEFNCLPSSGSGQRLCQVRIHNWLNSEETEGLSQIEKQTGIGVTFFRDVDGSVTREIRESFVGLPIGLSTARPMLLQTLVLMKDGAYASIGARLEDSVASDLEAAYAGEGLGTFVSTVKFRGERTEEYLAVAQTQALRNLIEQARLRGIAASEIRSRILETVPKNRLQVVNISDAEAETLLYRTIKSKYFKRSANGTYVASKSAGQVGERLELLNETTSPVNMVCEISLVLKKDAVPSLNCHEEVI